MKETCPSILKLSLSLLADELSQKEWSDIQIHLSGCARCRQRLVDLKRERETLFQKVPRLDLGGVGHRSLWRPALVAASACLLLVLGLWLLIRKEEQPQAIAFKGETPSLAFRVERQGNVFEGRPNMYLRPGDRIRFAYSIGEDAYLIIVNVDNDGRVTAYYPDETGSSLVIRKGEKVFLPGSIRLDEYIGKERIFAVFTRKPILFQAIESAVQKAWRQSKDIENIETLPIDGYQVTILFTKTKDNE
jgi:hypothetical protein